VLKLLSKETTEMMFELCQNLLILTDTMYYFELNKRFKITEETF
jgi:hypothetical protein